MRILFVDDDPQHVEVVQRTVAEALGAEVNVVATVEAAVTALHTHSLDLLVTDIFIPLGPAPRQSLGPRSRRYRETLEHLGGLVLLDELDRLPNVPRVLAHTACTDFALIEILGEQEAQRNTRIVLTRLNVPGGEDVIFNYRLRMTPQGWQIIDIYLKGTVSELALRRSDFTTTLKKKGFPVLASTVDQKIANLREEAGG